MTLVDNLIERGNSLFSKRSPLMTLWQDIADNFYVQRADFTVSRSLGDDFASHLYSSYPLYVHRELSNSFAGMLRPLNLEWFGMTIQDEQSLTRTGRMWLEMATKRQRTWMYDKRSQFTRATKEGDADFAGFGQAVLEHSIDWSKPALLYQCWHLRDVAWDERRDGTIGEIHRKWKPTIADLAGTYKGKLHPNVQKHVDTKEQFQRVECRVVVVDADLFHGLAPSSDRQNKPWMRLVIDVENKHVMEQVGLWTSGYTIPRWQTVSGSQYAYSPATIIGLPDARLIQAMTLTLLEAGEMAVRPPLIATQEAVRGDLNVFAGGVTWVDAEYNEKLGSALRPLTQDKSGLPWGLEFAQGHQLLLAAAFYLNKLTLPTSDREMTAYETSQRIQEYIREALPLFEPMETQYNGGLCEGTFDDLFRAGVFGPLHDIPRELLGEEVHFKFKSPLHDAIERQTGAHFMESAELIRTAIEMDPSAVVNLDVNEALRDALTGIGSPPAWLRDKDKVASIIERLQQEKAAQRDAELVQQGAEAAQAIRDAA